MDKELIICRRGPELPPKTVVTKLAVVGMSGSGKTQTGRKLAEAMLDINQHIGVLDPLGVWWGLRSSADGNTAGYPIVVFGGTHRQDAPLDVDAGTALAHAFIQKRFNAIFDMSLFSAAEVRRFCTDFLNVLNQQNSKPVHLFLDEFDIICPQAKGANSEESREACNNTVRRTRIKGIGVTMISQNPQDVDKSVLNMADTVIAMRTQGSQAIDAIGKWMGRNLAKERLQEMMVSLPELATGSGWIWAPQAKVFEVADFLLCKTFDSSKTPELGETIEPPKVLARVDIARLGKTITASIEAAKEEDPKHLHEIIRKLREEIARGGKKDMGFIEDAQRQHDELVELRSQIERFPQREQELQERIQQMQERENDFLARVNNIVGELRTLVESVDTGVLAQASARPPQKRTAVVATLPAGRTPTVAETTFSSTRHSEAVAIKAGARKMLEAVASMHPKGLSTARVAIMSNMKKTGGTFSDYKSLLKRAGYVEVRGDEWFATPDGVKAVGATMHAVPKTTADVLAIWTPKMKGKMKPMLDYLISRRGRWVLYSELAGAVAMEAKGGTFSDYLSLLRTMDLITTDSGRARANAEVLFL